MKTPIAPLVLAGMLVPSVFAQESKTNLTAPLPQPTNSVSTAAPIRIPASEAKDHLNALAIVTGKIAEVNQTDRLVRLNLDQPYPKQAMTAVIFGAKTNEFTGLEKLKGQTVEISGKIADYRGRPEIILNSTNQLKVISASAPAATPENK